MRIFVLRVCLLGLLSQSTGAQSAGHVRVLSSTETSAEIAGDGYSVKLQFAPDPELTISSFNRSAGWLKIGTFPLEGYVETTDQENSHTQVGTQFEGSSLEKYKDTYQLTIRYRSSIGNKHEVSLHFYAGFFSYALTVGKAIPGQELRSVYYLARPDSDGTVGRNAGEFQKLHTWTPDLYDVSLPEQGISRVILSSHGGTGDPGYLRGQYAGSPLVPPYVVAIRTGVTWWGVGTLGIPSTYNGLGVQIGKRSFAVTFDAASAASASEKQLCAPTVGFYFGNDPNDVLIAYRASLLDAGHAASPAASSWPTWWSGPIYCTWGDQVYAARMLEGRLDEENGPRYATQKNLDRWLGIAKREHLPIRTVILDLGWMLGYGDFEPNPRYFPDLRAFIDKLHAEGLHVLLWMPMYEATGKVFSLEQENSEVASKHPDWLIRTRENHATDIFDYTNPEVREYVRSRIHHMLSSEAGHLNADGLKIDFVDRLPDPGSSVFHDASWGTGELMSSKVLELIHKAAKESKSDAMIDSSFMNPLFHGRQDVIRLNDDVSNSVETYWWRAWAATVNGVKVIDGDDWWAMERYFVPLTLAKSAWGIPNIYALEYRGALGTEAVVNGVKSTASGGYPVEISENSYRQVRAILEVYLHAPADNRQEPQVDPVLQQASRTYKIGPLQGFFAARTLNFARTLVTYTPQSAWLTSTADGEISVPLPKGYVTKSVSAVDFEGRKSPISFNQNADSVRIRVQDSARGISRYVIRYERVHTGAPLFPGLR